MESDKKPPASSSAAVGGKHASSSVAVGGKHASSSVAVGGKNAKASGNKGAIKPYTRPRGAGARAIGDLMPEIGRTAFRRFGFVQSSVVTRWPEIVGPQHARICSPEAIRFPPGEKAEGILDLVVVPAHAPLIQQVIPEIIERVNRFFGYRAVARVKLRQGAVTPPVDGRPAKPPPSLKPIPLELGDSLRDIGDPELRTVLESLARSLGNSETPSSQDNDQQ
jgi:hypothetical protein